jgi:hypothetical protein
MSYFNRKERTLKINKKAGGRFIDKRINWRQSMQLIYLASIDFFLKDTKRRVKPIGLMNFGIIMKMKQLMTISSTNPSEVETKVCFKTFFDYGSISRLVHRIYCIARFYHE